MSTRKPIDRLQMELGATWNGHLDIRFFRILMMCANIKIQTNVHLLVLLAKIG